jgi:Zn-finger nucleic acid-binding protein
MEPVVVDEVTVDRCTGCGGLWFDVGEHEALRKRRGSESIDTGDPDEGRRHDDCGDVDCPRCSARMVKMVVLEQPHIWYETCSVCGGAYFDAGEFTDFKRLTPADIVRRLFVRERR